MYNNIDEFEDIFQDCYEGVFEELFRVKDLIEHDQDISRLLFNDNLGFISVFFSLLFEGIIYKIITFLILFLILFKGLGFQ